MIPKYTDHICRELDTYIDKSIIRYRSPIYSEVPMCIVFDYMVKELRKRKEKCVYIIDRRGIENIRSEDVYEIIHCFDRECMHGINNKPVESRVADSIKFIMREAFSMQSCDIPVYENDKYIEIKKNTLYNIKEILKLENCDRVLARLALKNNDVGGIGKISATEEIKRSMQECKRYGYDDLNQYITKDTWGAGDYIESVAEVSTISVGADETEEEKRELDFVDSIEPELRWDYLGLMCDGANSEEIIKALKFIELFKGTKIMEEIKSKSFEVRQFIEEMEMGYYVCIKYTDAIKTIYKEYAYKLTDEAIKRLEALR